MFLFMALYTLLDGAFPEYWSGDGGSNIPDFPKGKITSAAWAGWWHEEVV